MYAISNPTRLWCRAFESAGLPAEYWPNPLNQSIAQSITTYLGAPNPINTLNVHLGQVIHVLIPPCHTAQCLMAACVADVAKTTFWVAGIKGLASLSASRAPGEHAAPHPVKVMLVRIVYKCVKLVQDITAEVAPWIGTIAVQVCMY